MPKDLSLSARYHYVVIRAQIGTRPKCNVLAVQESPKTIIIIHSVMERGNSCKIERDVRVTKQSSNFRGFNHSYASLNLLIIYILK
tara:strand:+ start:183 stop:440 length:258 start_codon:yes stop_codon:yes gene_type:complete